MMQLELQQQETLNVKQKLQLLLMMFNNVINGLVSFWSGNKAEICLEFKLSKVIKV